MEVIITKTSAQRPLSHTKTHTFHPFASSVCFFLPHWFCLLFVSQHWKAFFNAQCRSVPNCSIKWVIISYGLLKDKRAFVHLFLQGKSPLPPFSCCMRIRKLFGKHLMSMINNRRLWGDLNTGRARVPSWWSVSWIRWKFLARVCMPQWIKSRSLCDLVWRSECLKWTFLPWSLSLCQWLSPVTNKWRKGTCAIQDTSL